MYVNKIILVGFVGNDPTVVKGSVKDETIGISTFSMATNETWKIKKTNERASLTEWHKIVIYNPYYNKVVTESVKKGTLVYVEGKLHHRKYTTPAGETHQSPEVHVSFGGKVNILRKKIESDNALEENSDSPTNGLMDDFELEI